MLSVDGDADAAVEARIRIGWNKLRHLVPLLTNRDISLIRRGRLYSSCVQCTGWLCGPAVEHRSLAGVLSLSCARLVADG